MNLLKPFIIAFVLMSVSFTSIGAQQPKSPADLHRLAADYYNWRNQQYPVFSSDAGLHTWDNKLTDYSLSAVLARKLYVKELLAKVRAMPCTNMQQRKLPSLLKKIMKLLRCRPNYLLVSLMINMNRKPMR